MVKTIITETTEKFDENGKLLERVTRTEESNDDTVYYPNWNTTWNTTPWRQNTTYVPSVDKCEASVE